MYQKRKERWKKVKASLLSFLFITSALLGTSIPIKADTNTPTELEVLAQTGASVRLGDTTAFWHAGIGKAAVDGKIAFCIEPTTFGLEGPYHVSENDWSESTRRTLSQIVYYGWDTSSKSNDDYAATQFMLWEAIGATIVEWHGNFGERYPALKSVIQSKINQHNVVASFANTSQSVTLGSSLTLTDSNRVLNAFHVKEDGGCDVSITSNTLTITPKDTTNENTTIVLQKQSDDFVGASIAYRSANGQDVGVFKLPTSVQMRISLQVEKYGSLKLTKYDDEALAVPGTQFTLSYQSDMSNPIGTYTTLADGSITIDGLKANTNVYYQEVNVPAPLVLDTTIKSVTIQSNQTQEESITNLIQKGSVSLRKVDKETGVAQGDATLAGAIYELRAAQDIINPMNQSVLHRKDSVIATRTTKADGTCDRVDNLYTGMYYWQEVEASEGYLLNEEQIVVDLTYQGEHVSTITKAYESKETIKKGKHRIFKTSTLGGSGILNGLEGAQFTYKLLSEVNEKGWEDATTYDVITSDKNGFAMTKSLPYGMYLVKETYTPDGKVQAPDFTIMIEEDGEEYFDVINNRPFEAYLRIVKEDEEGKQITLSSASFQIKDSEGNIVIQKVGETYVSSFTTDTNGKVTTPLKLANGTYTIEEVVTPDGFIKSEEAITFHIDNRYDYTLDNDNDAIVVVHVVNEKPYGEIQLQKQWEEDDGEIKQAKFKLYAQNTIVDPSDGSILYEEGDLIVSSEHPEGIYTTDANGKLVISGLPLSNQEAKYVLEEVESAIGYVTKNHRYPVTFTQEDNTKKVYVAYVDVTNKKTQIQVSKTSVGGEEIAGAEMMVMDEEGTIVDAWTSDGTPHIIKGLAIETYYTLYETYAPEGYVVSNAVSFYVENSEELQQVTMIDKRYGIQKVDATLEVGLAGAHFVVTSLKTKNIVDAWISDGDIHYVSNLVEGETYQLVEIEAPEGYETMEAMTFTPSSEKEDEVIQVDNIRMNFLLEIHKINEHHDLIVNRPFTFTLYADETCSEVVEEVTSDDGIALFSSLHYGTYYLKETQSPNGYHQLDRVFTITINDDGVFVDEEALVEEEGRYQYEIMNRRMERISTGDINGTQALLFTMMLSLCVLVLVKGRKEKE